jgi:uncharacterized protein YndB with AHSA1/START domain
MSAGAELATVVVGRVVPASPADVYAAWVDPATLATFIAPPPGAAEVEIDPRVGGRMRIVMTFPDRVTEIEGAYLALDPPRGISFSWRPLAAGFDSVVAVAFEPHGEGETWMTITHTRLPAEWRGSYDRGWDAIARQAAAAIPAR